MNHRHQLGPEVGAIQGMVSVLIAIRVPQGRLLEHDQRMTEMVGRSDICKSWVIGLLSTWMRRRILADVRTLVIS